MRDLAYLGSVFGLQARDKNLNLNLSASIYSGRLYEIVTNTTVSKLQMDR